MAKKEEPVNFSALTAELRKNGPQRLYLLWGPEDYLRERFADAVKAACLPGGEDDFSYRLINGPELDVLEVKEAVDSVPFMSERTLVVLRGADINRIKDQAADTLIGVLSDIPDYCTVIFAQDSAYEPDGRLKLVKNIKKLGREIKFTAQGEDALISWIQKRFAALGKSIDYSAARQLIFVSGTLMNRLIPEIDKIAAYAAGESVSKSDVEAVAHHIPEARVFDMTDCIAAKNPDGAARILAELMGDKDNPPIMLLAAIGRQMRNLYTAKLAADEKLGRKFVEDNSGIKFPFLLDKLIKTAGGFTLAQTRRAVELCCDADYAMKSTGGDSEAILKDVVMRIASGEC
jgi:DNA polymerase-3 subunit delta